MNKEKEHEQLYCPICNGDSIVLDLVRTINPEKKDKVQLRECISCKHWFHSPMPKQEYLLELYRTNSESVMRKGTYSNYMKQAMTKTKPKEVLVGFNSFVYENDNKNSGKKYLEIGVGGGSLFKFLSNNGWECHGVDPGIKKSYLSLFPNIDSLPYDKYDVIVLSDVLEHLEDPLKMMRDLKNKAKKGTRIYCSFPNKDSFPAAIKKGSWWIVLPLGHLHYFSERSVFALFNKAGWDIKELRKVNALHNELFNNLNPLVIIRKIINIPNCWKDQFWVSALSN